MVTNEEMEMEDNTATAKDDLPESRWEVVNSIYEKLDRLLCDEVNANELTFIEINTIMKLLSLKLLKCEVKHLVDLSIGELLHTVGNNSSCTEGNGKQDRLEECYT